MGRAHVGSVANLDVSYLEMGLHVCSCSAVMTHRASSVAGCKIPTWNETNGKLKG